MNLIEVDRSLRELRLGGMAAALEARIREAQTEKLPHLDLIARLLNCRFGAAGFRDTDRTLDGFDFDFNKKMNRRLVFDLAAGHFVTKHEDALFLGPPGTGKATSPRPSLALSSSRATKSCTARSTPCSRSSPTPPLQEVAKKRWPSWLLQPSSSSMTLACESSHPPLARTCLSVAAQAG